MVAIVAGIALSTGDGDETDRETEGSGLEVVRSAPLLSTPLPRPKPGGGTDTPPESLLWAEQAENGLILHRMDLRTGRSTGVPGWPSHAVSVAPGGEWAIVAEEGGALVLVEIRSGDEFELGAGDNVADLLWSPDGQRLALVRAGTRVGDLEVFLISVDDPKLERVLPMAPWRMVGWGADHFVAYHRTMKQIVFVDPTGGLRRLPAPPGEFAGISPDGRWLVAQPQGKDLLFHDIPALQSFVLPLQGRVIDNLQWLPDGRALAASAESADPLAESAIMLVDPFARGFSLLPGTEGAVEAMATERGGFYVYASGHTGSWDLSMCAFPGDCRSVGDLPLGVSFIGLT